MEFHDIVLDFFRPGQKAISVTVSGDWGWKKTRHLFSSKVSGLCPMLFPVQPVNDTSNPDMKKICIGNSRT